MYCCARDRYQRNSSKDAEITYFGDRPVIRNLMTLYSKQIHDMIAIVATLGSVITARK